MVAAALVANEIINSTWSDDKIVIKRAINIGVAVAAVAHGATVIEKHFTLCRADGGVDSGFSLEPEEMKLLVIDTERARLSLGKLSYGPTEAEKGSLAGRRSLYIAQDMKKGEMLNEQNLRIIRPSFGLPPKFYDVIFLKETPIAWQICVQLL